MPTATISPPATPPPVLTPEMAQTILNCFGPCTTLYECTTAEELIEEFNKGQGLIDGDEPFASVKDFVAFQMGIEGIRVDRQLGVTQLEAETLGDQHHKNALVSANVTKQNVIGRLTAAGLL